MSQKKLLADYCQILAFIVTGYSECERKRDQVREFSSQDFYLDEDSIRDAIESQGMFNLIDLKEGDKVDFWLLTNETFDKSRFSRKYKEKLDELAKKLEFLEGVGVELKVEDYFNRGLDYYYKGKYEKAKEVFGKTAELKPDSAKIWYNIVKAMYYTN